MFEKSYLVRTVITLNPSNHRRIRQSVLSDVSYYFLTNQLTIPNKGNLLNMCSYNVSHFKKNNCSIMTLNIFKDIPILFYIVCDLSQLFLLWEETSCLFRFLSPLRRNFINFKFKSHTQIYKNTQTIMFNICKLLYPRWNFTLWFK